MGNYVTGMTTNDVESLLLPCPFCLGKATVMSCRNASSGNLYWTVGCALNQCRGGHGSTAGPELEKEIADWNKRPSNHETYIKALQRIALLADCGSEQHKREYALHYSLNSVAVPGWRVAEDIREIANDVIGSLPLRSRFNRGDRVRVKFGVDRGHYGTVRSVGGDDGSYYGVKLDCHDAEMGYSEYELGAA